MLVASQAGDHNPARPIDHFGSKSKQLEISMKSFQDKSLMAAVLMAGLSAASYSSAVPLRATADQRTNSVRIGSGGIAGSNSRRAGYGWTNRHQQRVAKKARNVKRHRAACR